MANDIERKIHFFVMESVDDPVLESGARKPVDPLPALTKIDGLSFVDADVESSRYFYAKAHEGEVLYCVVDELSDANGWSYLRWMKSRRSALPQIETEGSFSNLDLAENAGLAEAAHVVFFDHNIVAFEFNIYAPRLSSLAVYLKSKATTEIETVSFIPLIKPNVLKEIRQMEDVRLVKIRGRASYADAVKKADASLGSAFKATASAAEAEVVEIVLKKVRDTPGIVDRMIRFASALYRQKSAREELEEVTIRGRNGVSERVESLDVLSDKLVAKKKILRASPTLRVIDTPAAYQAIIEAYKELIDDLLVAAGEQ